MSIGFRDKYIIKSVQKMWLGDDKTFLFDMRSALALKIQQH